MANTKTSISIASSNLIPGMGINYYKTSNLLKAGSCDGLPWINANSRYFQSTTQVEFIDENGNGSQMKQNGANKIFIINKTPVFRPTASQNEYVEMGIDLANGPEILGRLYGNDWMFIPFSGGTDNDITIKPSTASTTYMEYILIYENA